MFLMDWYFVVCYPAFIVILKNDLKTGSVFIKSEYNKAYSGWQYQDSERFQQVAPTS